MMMRRIMWLYLVVVGATGGGDVVCVIDEVGLQHECGHGR